METRTLTLYAETGESAYRMARLDHDPFGFHVYYFEHGECLCSDTFDNELEAKLFLKNMIATW